MANEDAVIGIGVESDGAIQETDKFAKYFTKQITNLQKLGGINLTFDKNSLGNLRNITSGFNSNLQSTVGEVGKLRQAWDQLDSITLPSLRYALYDVSNSLRNISAISGAAALVPIGFSIRYEREFANVIRTNELAGESNRKLTEELRKDLLAITQTTPISWADITNIATLAGQLGIAQELVADFTETVAKFAATTDLTVTAAATAFGRLDQLIGSVDGNFEALGSAILAVGVDSVATESQIVNVSTQIASMGNLAGLTAPEIVGLSGALASLGVSPELSRGVVTRLFSNIGASAVAGGFNVAEFGRITGRTAEEFVSDWGSEPGRVLQDFFAGINAEGPEAERTLRELGITSVRDIPTILRLAQSSDEVSRLIAKSSDEYLYATKLSEQYGIISGTTAEQLNRLTQNFQTLQATIGDSIGPLAGLIQLFNNFVQGLTAFASIPILGDVLGGAVIITALLVSGLTALGSVLVGAVAGAIALRFAVNQLNASGVVNIKTNLGFIGTLRAIAKEALAATGATGALSVGMRGVGAASSSAAVGVAALGSALRFFGIIGIVLGVLSTLVTVWGSFTNAVSDSDERIQKFFGSTDNLRKAIDEDSAAFDESTKKFKDGTEALKVYSQEVDTSTGALKSRSDVADEFIDSEGRIKTAVEETTGAIEKQTRAVGTNTLEYFRGALLQDADIVTAFADPGFQQLFIDAGADITGLLAAGIEGNSDEYIARIIAVAKQGLEALRAEQTELTPGRYESISDEDRARLYEVNQLIAQQTQYIAVLEGAFTEFGQAQSDAIAQDEEFRAGLEGTANVMGEVAAKTNLAEGEIKQILSDFFSGADYIRDVEDSLVGFADALAESGDQGEAVQGVLESIFSEPNQDVNIILGNLGAFLTLLQQQEAQGYNTAASQALVQDLIRRTGQEAGIQAPNMIQYAKGLNAVANFDASNFQDILASAIERVGETATRSAGRVKTLSDRFKELTDSLFGPVNAAQKAADSVYQLGESYAELGNNAFYASSEIRDAVSDILSAASSPTEAVSNLNALFNVLANTVGSSTSPALQFLRNTINSIAASFGVASNAISQTTLDLSFFTDGVKNAQKTVRTLLDYASDIESVISRAFDIRFASIQQIDNIADAWLSISDNIQDARDQIDELRRAQEDLAADKSLKEYFLSIAETYGDTLRADKLRAEIEDINKEQAQNQVELTAAEATVGGDLTGNTREARRNRAALLGLVKEYQDYITTLAETGASQKELKEATEDARQEFIQQARELGFQDDVVLEYAEAFDDVTTAINKVPRNITVTANTNPAIQALNELNAKLDQSISKAEKLNQVTGTVRPPSTTPTTGGLTPAQVSQKKQQLANLERTLSAHLSDRRLYVAANALAAWTATRNNLQNQINALKNELKGYASGGFTGRGGKYEPAGIVHKGEYVVPKQYVNQSTGLPNAQFLAQLQNGMRGYAQGGFVSQTVSLSDNPVMVELSPYDRKLLENAGNVQLSLNGRVVAQATNANNNDSARRGSG